MVVIEGFLEQVGVWKMVFSGSLVIWRCGKGTGFKVRPMFKSWFCSILMK